MLKAICITSCEPKELRIITYTNGIGTLETLSLPTITKPASLQSFKSPDKIRLDFNIDSPAKIVRKIIPTCLVNTKFRTIFAVFKKKRYGKS